MEINAIAGIGGGYPYSPINGGGYPYSPINGILASGRDDRAHKANRALLSPARVAFLALVKVNLWAMASIIFKGFQKSGEIRTYWSNAWYNVGGNPNKLLEAVSKGKNRRSLLLKTAPSQLRSFLQSKGLAGLNGNCSPGIGGGIGTVTMPTLEQLGSPEIVQNPNAQQNYNQIAEIVKIATKIITDFLGLITATGNASGLTSQDIPPETWNIPNTGGPQGGGIQIDTNTLLIAAIAAILLLKK